MHFLNKTALLFLLGSLLFLGSACVNNERTVEADPSLVKRLDSLEQSIEILKEQIAPGLGELMNTNQLYIQKLANDIATGNWDYADFHMHELEEIFERIEELHNHHDELVQPADVQLKAFIFPAFEKLESAIDAKDKTIAEKEYLNLKSGCNNCHKANNMAYIVIE